MQWPIAIVDNTSAARLFRLAVAGVLLLLATQAAAQLSGSASALSDYRFRGVSLSNGHAEPQLQLGYDGRSGWYAGGFASGVDIKGEGNSHTQLQAYAGFSTQRSSGLGWEVGATGSVFPHAAIYNYTEVFAGLAFGNVAGRLYFSPDYFGLHARAIYAELNGSRTLQKQVHLLSHIGLRHAFERHENPEAYATNQADVSISASADLADWKIRLTWAAARKNDADAQFYDGRSTHGWVLSASYAF